MKKDKAESILNHDEFIEPHGPIVPPIYQNSLFAFKDWDAIDNAFSNKSEDYIYSRLLNPTAKIVEDKIALLAGAEKAKLCASGIAAITSAILHCVKSNDHIITINKLYGPSNTFINGYLKDKLNISCSFVNGKDPEEFEKHIQDNTSLIYLESPASLSFDLQDIRAVVEIARKHNIKTVIDNTWATPLFQKPLEMGVDIEVHSVSKYLCGHSDVVAGIILSNKETLDAILLSEHELLGAKIAPFEAWLILRSLRTLVLRMEAHQKNAMRVAEFLESHSNVKKIYYPGLKSFEQYDLALRQMSGFSGLLSFELNTSDISKIKAFVDSLHFFKLGVSWGGHDSLVYAPVISYLKELKPDQFAAMGIKESMIRLSIGLENVSDLIEDLNKALLLV